MATPKAFVTGATGTQGGAVARQLRALGWQVDTVTRDPSSPAAQALASIGVTCHAGDWRDEAVLETALRGSDALFLNLMPDLSDLGSELPTGKNIVRLARAAGTRRVVYSGFLDLPSLRDEDPFGGLWQLARDAKLGIEQAVRAAGFESWTLLRPGFLMANFVDPKARFLYPGAAHSGVFTLAYRPDTALPLVDHEDIAAFAVAALRDPLRRFHGHTINLVGDLVPVHRALAMLARAARRPLRAVYLSDDQVRDATATSFLLSRQALLRDADTAAYAEEATRWGIPLGSFERFLAREAPAVRETYAKVPQEE